MSGLGLSPPGVGNTERHSNHESGSSTTDEGHIGDDEKWFFGDDDDFSIQFDSDGDETGANTGILIRNENTGQVVLTTSTGNNTLLKLAGYEIARAGSGVVTISNGNDEIRIGEDLSIQGNALRSAGRVEYNPVDVRNISSPAQGWVAYHDGSGTNTEGLAAFDGSNWVSQVDGSTIS